MFEELRNQRIFILIYTKMIMFCSMENFKMADHEYLIYPSSAVNLSRKIKL